MKNIIQLVFVIAFLCSIQFRLNAQRPVISACEIMNTATDQTKNDYYAEIDGRLGVVTQRMADMCSSINLLLDADGNGNPNFAVLNDRDFYVDSHGGNTYGWNECKWPYINKYNHNDYDSNIQYIILTPGDYRDYLSFKPNSGTNETDTRFLLYYPGSSDAPLDEVIAYFNNNYCENLESAIEQEEEDRAIVEGFDLTREAGFQRWTWVIMGITFRGNHADYYSSDYATEEECPAGKYTGGKGNTITSSGNIMSHCLLENAVNPHFIRIGDGDNNIIINNVIRNRHDMSHRDVLGVTISASYYETADNNAIVDNDIYNIGDAIQLVYKSNCSDPNTDNPPGCIDACMPNSSINDCECDQDNLSNKGTAPGTFIHNNRLFNQKIYYQDDEIEFPDGTVVPVNIERMHGEGAIDLKIGAEDGEAKVIISNNSIYGWREGRKDPSGTQGGNGHAIATHNRAQNIVIMNNQIRDCTNGIHIRGRGSVPERDWVDLNDNGVVDPDECIEMEVKNIEVYDNDICDLYSPLEKQQISNLGLGMYHGIAISASIQSVKISGNNVKNIPRGIVLGGEGYLAEISDNYFEKVINQFFRHQNPTYTHENAYENFRCNTFLDSGYKCDTNHLNGDLEGYLKDNDNCFLKTKRKQIGYFPSYEEVSICE